MWNMAAVNIDQLISVKINKSMLIASMKTGVKGSQKITVWRTITATGAALLWTSGCAAAMTLLCKMCVRVVETTLLLCDRFTSYYHDYTENTYLTKKATTTNK